MSYTPNHHVILHLFECYDVCVGVDGWAEGLVHHVQREWSQQRPERLPTHTDTMLDFDKRCMAPSTHDVRRGQSKVGERITRHIKANTMRVKCQGLGHAHTLTGWCAERRRRGGLGLAFSAVLLAKHTKRRHELAKCETHK